MCAKKRIDSIVTNNQENSLQDYCFATIANVFFLLAVEIPSYFFIIKRPEEISSKNV